MEEVTKLLIKDIQYIRNKLDLLSQKVWALEVKAGFWGAIGGLSVALGAYYLKKG